MLKISTTLVAVAALSATLVTGGMAWANSTHASVKGSATSSRPITVVVPAKDSNWTNTGVTLQAHHALDIRARGIVNYGLGPVYPSGKSLANSGCAYFSRPAGYTFTAPQLSCWSLIGRIGNGHPFQVSGHLHLTDSTAGKLFLIMNDANGAFGDNSGSWTVAITTS
jgi:hypothetical protein